MNQSESHFYRRVFSLAAAGLLAFALFKILEPFIGPMLWALLLAFLLFPVNQGLRRMLRGCRGVAAILLTLVVTLLLVIPASLLAAAFTGQASELVGLLQEAAGRYHIVQASDLLRVPILDRAIQGIVGLVPVTAEQIQGWIVEAGKRLLQILVTTSGSFFAGALRGFVDLVLTLFLFFFFLRDGEEMAAVTRAVVVGLLVT